MDFLNECLLNTDKDFLTEMVETCNKPAVILSKEKRITVKSPFVHGDNVLVSLGLPAGKGKLRAFYRYLKELKDGDVVKLERGGSIKGLLICFPIGYLFYFDDTLTEKPENEPDFVYSSTITLVTRRNRRKATAPPRSRRDQALEPPKDENVVELKQDSLYKRLSGERTETEEEQLYFSPDGVAQGVCDAVKRMLLEKGTEFDVSVEKAELYCDDSYDKYSNALMTMLLVAVARTETDSIKVRGVSDGSRYTVTFSFKCRSAPNGKSGDVFSWEALFGEYFDEMYAVSRQLFWKLGVMKRRGGFLELTLTVPLSQKSSSLLHPQTPPPDYYEGLVKKHYALLW